MRRENGWYWVLLEGCDAANANDWQVGNYHDGKWYLIGMDAYWSGNNFAKIGPRIEPPVNE